MVIQIIPQNIGQIVPAKNIHRTKNKGRRHIGLCQEGYLENSLRTVKRSYDFLRVNSFLIIKLKCILSIVKVLGSWKTTNICTGDPVPCGQRTQNYTASPLPWERRKCSARRRNKTMCPSNDARRISFDPWVHHCHATYRRRRTSVALFDRGKQNGWCKEAI